MKEEDLQVVPAEPVLPVPVDPAGVAAGVDYGGDDAEEEAGSSTDVSSSASDVSADPRDLVNLVPDDAVWTELAWFRQGSKIHVVREKNEDQRGAPWCRRGQGTWPGTWRSHPGCSLPEVLGPHAS